MSLEVVKMLTKGDEAQLAILYTQMEQRLLNRINRSLTNVLEIPVALEYIVDELTIIRFNRIGDEGMKISSVEGKSTTYDGSDLLMFEREIQEYIDVIEPPVVPTTSGIVRFL